MPLVVADRVRDTTTTTGTGTVTLSGTAPTGYQNFSVIGNGNTTYYVINGGSQWEVGIGTYSSAGPTLSRDTVLASSAGGTTKVTFSAGTKDVFVTYPSAKSVYQDGTGIAAGTSVLSVANGGTGTNTAFTTGSVVFAGTSGNYTQDNATFFWDNTNKRLGVGTASPGYRLDIASADTTASIGYVARLRSNATATAASLQFTNSGATLQTGLLGITDAGVATLQGDGASSAIALRTNGNERVRVDSSGNFGIGVSSLTYKLEVAGDARLGSGGDLRISSATGTTTPSGDTTLYNDINNLIITTGTTTAERMRITSTGDVGIGTSSPGYRLEVNASSGSSQVAYFVNTSTGSALGGVFSSINSGGNNTSSYHFAGVTQGVAIWYLYGNGTTSYTSDIRVKKNVTTTRDGYLEDVCKLRVVKYNWYTDSDDTPRELGFIAQEVEQVFPGLVQDAMHPTKDGEVHKVLKGSVLIPIMLKALQEANAKIDALTARVAQLEAN